MSEYYSDKEQGFKDIKDTIKRRFLFFHRVTLVISLVFAFSYEFFSSIYWYFGVAAVFILCAGFLSMKLFYTALATGIETTFYWSVEVITTVIVLIPMALAMCYVLSVN
ncbi:hypothetical protein QXB71_002686 [Vibrio cholerae]|nr:hypothetical protein [Vibrio cholerae]